MNRALVAAPFEDIQKNIVYIRLEKILVFPAASSPSIKILISLFPNIFDSSFPIFQFHSICYKIEIKSLSVEVHSKIPNYGMLMYLL